MSKKLSSWKSLTLFICISLLINESFECHPSCICSEGENKCLSCVDIHSAVDPRSLSCPCIDGWFTSSLIPFRCEEYLKNGCGSDSAQILDSCNVEIGRKVRDVNIVISNKYTTSAQGNFISVVIILDFSNISMSDSCLDQFRSNLQYIQTKANNTYYNFPTTVAIPGPRGFWNLTLPINGLSDYADSSGSQDGQIVTLINLQLLIGTPTSINRIHTWNLIVSTQVNQVILFNIKQSALIGQAQNNCIDCIVVADVQTKSKVCIDDSCLLERLNTPYSVGEYFRAQISFVDPSYTSKLSFVSLVIKTDDNTVYDLSTATIATWQDDHLFVSVKLPYASLQAVIQISMEIHPIDGQLVRRILTVNNNITENHSINNISNSQSAQQVFHTVIISDKSSYNYSNTLNTSFMVIAILFALVLI